MTCKLLQCSTNVAVLCRVILLRYFDCHQNLRVVWKWDKIWEWSGNGHMHFVDSLDIHASTCMKHVWPPPLTEVQWYGASNKAMDRNKGIVIVHSNWNTYCWFPWLPLPSYGDHTWAFPSPTSSLVGTSTKRERESHWVENSYCRTSPVLYSYM